MGICGSNLKKKKVIPEKQTVDIKTSNTSEEKEIFIQKCMLFKEKAQSAPKLHLSDSALIKRRPKFQEANFDSQRIIDTVNSPTLAIVTN
ncbi:unnamed protein product [Blepharisma stoltei]|uniref:Uncharacterized protein n=1 Tax=Blepharisma stoltei TaxID=1481888 RepID=A0AAU9JRU1_9CILI|nr:unnamed protein product [Blepharisma stoltei]